MDAPVTSTFDDVALHDGPLTLRAPSTADVPAIVTTCRDPLTQQWLPLPNPYDETHALDFVTDLARATWRSGLGIVRAIESDGDFAGMIDLKKTDWRGLTTEIGYWVCGGADDFTHPRSGCARAARPSGARPYISSTVRNTL